MFKIYLLAIGGAILIISRLLWVYHRKRADSALTGGELQPEPSIQIPPGICSDCHGLFIPIGEFIERCNSCGEIRELLATGVWIYHFRSTEKIGHTEWLDGVEWQNAGPAPKETNKPEGWDN